MTLYDIIRTIEQAAAKQPAVNMIVRQDVRKLNTAKDSKYAAFAWTQGTHRGLVGGDIARYTFDLFYVDRLVTDGGNLEVIQSVGIEVIRGILADVLESVPVEVSEWVAHPFTQRFLDECGGVWVEVTVTAPVSYVCTEETTGLGDFSYDYNNDYYIRK